MPLASSRSKGSVDRPNARLALGALVDTFPNGGAVSVLWLLHQHRQHLVLKTSETITLHSSHPYLRRCRTYNGAAAFVKRSPSL